MSDAREAIMTGPTPHRTLRIRRLTGWLLAVVIVAAAAGCSAGSAPSAPLSPGAAAAGAVGVPTPAHVVVLVLENKDAAAVIGSPNASYITSLTQRGALFTNSHALTHPSQPNYLALFAGDTFGINDDHCPTEGPRSSG
ncbi:MAG: hypothetical protein ABR608_15675 [Pseudonocardiaceae bacterium]